MFRVLIRAVAPGLLVGAILSFSGTARGAYSLTSADPASPIVENFDAFVGTAASVPANITLSSLADPLTFNGVFTGGTSAYSRVNGIYAGTQSSNPADHSLVTLRSFLGALSAKFTVTNNTGTTLAGLTIRFNQEQYQDAVASPSFISLLSDNGIANNGQGGTTFDGSKLSGNHNNFELSAGGTSTVYATPLTATRTSIYLNPVEPGASVQFLFSWHAGFANGDRPIQGVDDLSIAAIPVPEPASLGLIGLVLATTAGRRRRRRQ